MQILSICINADRSLIYTHQCGTIETPQNMVRYLSFLSYRIISTASHSDGVAFDSK